MPDMRDSSLKQCVADLEREVAQLKTQIGDGTSKPNPWIEQLFGIFADEPAFEEAMKLGRKFRKSVDRKPRREKSVSHGHT